MRNINFYILFILLIIPSISIAVSPIVGSYDGSYDPIEINCPNNQSTWQKILTSSSHQINYNQKFPGIAENEIAWISDRSSLTGFARMNRHHDNEADWGSNPNSIDWHFEVRLRFPTGGWINTLTQEPQLIIGFADEGGFGRSVLLSWHYYSYNSTYNIRIGSISYNNNYTVKAVFLSDYLYHDNLFHTYRLEKRIADTNELGTGTMRIFAYFDGALVSNLPYTHYDEDQTSENGFIISTSNTQYCDVDIDQIEYSCNRPAPVQNSSEKVYWSFDENTGLIAADTGSDSNINDILSFGISESSIRNPSWSSDTPYLSQGSSIYFDGETTAEEGDYLYTASSLELSANLEEMTVEAWVKILPAVGSYDGTYDPCTMYPPEFQSNWTKSINSNSMTWNTITGISAWTDISSIYSNKVSRVHTITDWGPNPSAILWSYEAKLRFYGASRALNSTPQLTAGFIDEGGSGRSIVLGWFKKGSDASPSYSLAIGSINSSGNFVEKYTIFQWTDYFGYRDSLWRTYKVEKRIALHSEIGSGTMRIFISIDDNLIANISYDNFDFDNNFLVGFEFKQWESQYSEIELDYINYTINNSYKKNPIVNKENTNIYEPSYKLEIIPFGDFLRPRFAISSDGQNITELIGLPNSEIPINKWVHLAASLKKTPIGKRMILYLNGKEILNNRKIVSDDLIVRGSINQLWIGREGNYIARAKVDNICIFHYALNDLELFEHYNLISEGVINPIYSDFNKDYVVNFEDFVSLSSYWLLSNQLFDLDNQIPINFNDLLIFVNDWLSTQVMSDIVQSRDNFLGSPQNSDICFSSRWIRPLDQYDPYNTLVAARSFNSNRIEWLYLHWILGEDQSFLNQAHSQGYTVACSINASMPDIVGGSSRLLGRMEDLYGNLVKPPHYSTGLYAGCVNKIEYKNIIKNHIKHILDAGGDRVQCDDASLNANAVKYWGACYCDSCINSFNSYLELNFSSEKLQEWGINDISNFNYRSYLLGGGNNPYLSVQYIVFQEHSTTTFWQEMMNYSETYSGNNILFTANNSGWETPFHVFDYGVAELDIQSHLGDIIYKFYDSTQNNKRQIFTLKSEDIQINRKTIASCYALGEHLLAPWDVFVGTTERFFGNPSDFNDLYGFVASNPTLFDDYELSHVTGQHLPDSKFSSPPVSIGFGGTEVLAVTRAKPDNFNSPILIHLVDWNDYPNSFELNIEKNRFYSKDSISLTLYRPSKETVNLDFIQKNNFIIVNIPALKPWGILSISSN